LGYQALGDDVQVAVVGAILARALAMIEKQGQGG
jgi:hypothetical protein